MRHIVKMRTKRNRAAHKDAVIQPPKTRCDLTIARAHGVSGKSWATIETMSGCFHRHEGTTLHRRCPLPPEEKFTACAQRSCCVCPSTEKDDLYRSTFTHTMMNSRMTEIECGRS